MNKIAILLSTYNAQKYLKEQLDSILDQNITDFNLIVRDDLSTDNTLDILKTYKNIEIIPSNSQKMGATLSFFTLLRYASKKEFKYFMFCDQDDIWKKNKIEKLLEKMQKVEKINKNIPILIHSDLTVVDEKLKIIEESFWHYQKINPKLNSFNRLLIHNTVTGNSMMINSLLAKKIEKIPKNAIEYDWWIALVASSFGKIDFIKDRTIFYRQHSNNIIGANKINIEYFQKQIKKSNILNPHLKQAIEFYQIYHKQLDKNKQYILDDFTSIDKLTFWQKRSTLFKHRLFKQGLIRNVGLFLKI